MEFKLTLVPWSDFIHVL